MSHWILNYLRLPYAPGGRDHRGVDCWGLLRLVYAEQLGIELPLLPGIVDGRLVSREIVATARIGWQELNAPVEFCAVAMGRRQILHHVGIWTAADGGKVIHTWGGRAVVADTLRAVRHKGLQTVKFFAYGTHHSNSEPV